MLIKLFTYCIFLGSVLFPLSAFAKNVHGISEKNQSYFDLTKWNPLKTNSIELSGKWNFAWKVASLQKAMRNKTLIAVPGSWNTFTKSPNGYGWYVTHVTLPDSTSSPLELGLFFEKTYTAFNVYINGTKIHSCGKTGITEDVTIPMVNYQLVKIPNRLLTKTLSIAVFVSNFHHARGGLRVAPRLVHYNSYETSFKHRNFRDILLLGMIFMMGIYHFFLWIRMKDEISIVLFGVFCFIITVRVLSTNNFIERIFQNSFVHETRMALEYGTIVLGTSVFMEFIYNLFPRFFYRRIFYFFHACNAGLILFTVISPANIFSQYVDLFFIVLITGCMYMIIMLIREACNFTTGASIILIGFILFFITIANDILYSKSMINTVYIAQAGLVFFIICLAIVLSNRYAQALKTSARRTQLEEELIIARKIQQKLLPVEIPDSSFFSHSSRYIPVDTVGGDFYDIFENDERLLLFIADVSGHGLPGAFLSLITKMSLESIVKSEIGKNPAEILEALNTTIYNYTVNSNFVTAFLGSIDKQTKTFTFAKAGHMPPLIYRKKTKQFLDVTLKGRAMGWFDTVAAFAFEINLQEGDRIVLYTDGITENRNSGGELFGEKRLKELIEKYAQDTPENFSTKLMKELEKHNNLNNFEDDITLLVVDINHFFIGN